MRVGLSFFTMQDERSELLGRAVDLNTPGFLGRHIRDRILVEMYDDADKTPETLAIASRFSETE